MGSSNKGWWVSGRQCGAIVVLATLAGGMTTGTAGAQSLKTVDVVTPILAGATEITGHITPPNADVKELLVEIFEAPPASPAQDTAGRAAPEGNPAVLAHRVRITTFDRATGLFQVTVPKLKKDQSVRIHATDSTAVTRHPVTAAPTPRTGTGPTAAAGLQRPVIAPVSAGARTVTGWVTVSDKVTEVAVNVKVGTAVVERATTKAIGSDDGKFSVTLRTRLMPGQLVEAIAAAKDGKKGAAEVTVSDPFNWGRVRAYFSAGVVLAQERGEFSEQDLTLGFALDKSWWQAGDYACLLAADPCRKGAENASGSANQVRQADSVDSEDESDVIVPSGGWRPRGVNTFFNIRLTSLPVVAKPIDAEMVDTGMVGADMGMTPAPTDTMAMMAPETDGANTESGLDSFIASRKGATIEAGIYVPFFGKATSWMHQNSVNTLFLAPLVRGGIQTINGDASLEATTFGADDVYRFWSVGIGLGHYQLSGTTNRAPELVSYLHVTRGPFEAFKLNPIDSELDLEDIADPWRWSIEGRLKIPSSPFEVGFNANLGKGRDDVRFIVGTRFDVGELLGRLNAF